MKKIKLIPLIALAAIMVFATPAMAQPDSGLRTEHVYEPNFTVSEGELEIIDLGSWRYVETLYIQAIGTSRGDGRMDVMANGKIKGTIHVPRRDPSYAVTIRETIRYIEFRHIADADVRVLNITARQDEPMASLWDDGLIQRSPLGIQARNQAAKLSSRALQLVNKMSDFASYDEYGYYLMPIQKLAARSYAKAQARGDLSLQTRETLVALAMQIAYADDYISTSFERPAVFHTALELLTLQETIQALLQ